MNECFFMGEVITDIKFNFCYNSKNISIAKFDILIENEEKLTVIGYDEMADYVYCKLAKHNTIFIYGSLNTKFEMILKYIKIIT